MKSYNGFPPEQRTRSLTWLRKEIAADRADPPECCEACGQTEGALDYHAEDYSEPFTIEKLTAHPLCFMCHMMLHRRFSSPNEFRAYQSLIRQGGRYAPLSSRNIYGISWCIRSGEYGIFDNEGRTTHGIYDREDLIDEKQTK